MSRPLEGRCAVITGAAGGIGAAYARCLAADGAAVALVDRADCTALVEEIRSGGGSADAFACDLADMEAVAALGKDLLTWKTAPLILLNNIGAYPVTPVDTLDLDIWRRVFAINVDSPLVLSLALIPAMKADGWGRIINIGSSIVTIARSGVAAYASSKMAVIGMTRAMASDLGPHGITVNAISPGLTRTPGTETQLSDAGLTGMFDSFARNQPIRRVIEPDDLAGVAAFLASDASAMMTGQTLLVDGGLSRL